jgi:hypothetical protein
MEGEVVEVAAVDVVGVAEIESHPAWNTRKRVVHSRGVDRVTLRRVHFGSCPLPPPRILSEFPNGSPVLPTLNFGLTPPPCPRFPWGIFEGGINLQ